MIYVLVTVSFVQIVEFEYLCNWDYFVCVEFRISHKHTHARGKFMECNI